MRKVLAPASGLVTAIAAALLASPAAAEPGWEYNNALPGGIHECVAPRNGAGAANVPIYAFHGRRLSFNIGSTRAPDPCAAQGKLRILMLERLTVDGRTTYMNRGGGDNAGSTGQAHAHVPAGELVSPPAPLSSSVRAGNGRPAAGCTFEVYNYPRALPTDMLYKRANEGAGPGSAWKNYGNPGIDHNGETYNYILWNLPRRDAGMGEAMLDGGGIIRANIGPKTPVRACDVSQQYLDSFVPGTNTPNGYTRWSYVQTTNPNGQTIYGWFLVSYSYNFGPEVALFTWTP